jgi:DNA-directed RNA polymerase specialized sigma24 family protein
MNPPGTVTRYLHQFKAGDQAALQKLWEAYFGRLVRLARQKLRGAPCQMADSEDVALNAFDSFCRGVEAGRFPQLEDRHDLWQWLMMLTIRKASNHRRDAGAQKRGGGMVCNASTLQDEDDRWFADMIHSREPTPEQAAEAADECRRLLGALPEKLRQVALWKMEGYTNQEIADRLGRALVTAERKLEEIRAIWKKVMDG